MTHSPIAPGGVLSALVIAFAMSAFSAQPATAQTARNLKCKGCVNSRDVRNENLKAKDLADEGGTDYASGGADPNLSTTTPSSILSVTITAPRSGHVIVNTSGYFFYDTSGGAATCSITTGTTVDRDFEIRTQVIGPNTDTEFTPFAGTRGFPVTAGSTTFNLVCIEDTANVAVRDAILTAMYFPTLY